MSYGQRMAALQLLAEERVGWRVREAERQEEAAFAGVRQALSGS